MNLMEFQDRFSTDEACQEHIISKRWPDGYICEKCGSKDAWYWDQRRSFECKTCRTQKSITAGTLFHRSQTPLREWFLALYLMTESKKGISGLELQHHLGAKDERRIYDMQRKIREAMTRREERYQLEGFVEIDESFFGGTNPGGKPGRGSENKTAVLVSVSVNDNDRPEHVKMTILKGFDSDTLTKTVQQQVKKGSFLVTDGYPGYNDLSNNGYEHEAFVMETPRDNQAYLPWVHILISNAKCFINATHHSVKHLQRYLDEFCWRFNRRFCNLFDRMLVSALDYTPSYLLA